MEFMFAHIGLLVTAAVVLLGVLLVVFRSFTKIGENEMGVVIKNIAFKSLPQDEIIARHGEGGYQEELLAPGWRFRLWPFFTVERHPFIEVPGDSMGLVLSQTGKGIQVGRRTAEYKPEFGDYQNLGAFLDGGGQKGRQRHVLLPGTYRIHPAAFLVATSRRIYGIPMDPEVLAVARQAGGLNLSTFGLKSEDLAYTRITAAADSEGRGRGAQINQVGVVTVNEGPPLSDGQLACRLGGWEDVQKEEDNRKRIELLLGNKNGMHEAYQSYEGWVSAGGEMGLQHDVIPEGTYIFNPWLVTVRSFPVLHVQEGEVAVIKSRIGLQDVDVSGETFKYGSIVKPGHRGLWQDPIRTGAWLLNPLCYESTVVPTRILTLYWANDENAAGDLDSNLKTIAAKSKDGFEFKLELQVQIHISDVKAPRVISMVGSVQNLVDQVLQSAVGNYFRNKVQSMAATKFIEERKEVQEDALKYIREKLVQYEVETIGVFIQDVIFPKELADILQSREKAVQQKITYEEQEKAQKARVQMEKETGLADKQKELAASSVEIDIKKNQAEARENEAKGEAAYVTELGKAEGSAIREKGVALADALLKQREAVGQAGTIAVNVAKEVAHFTVPIVPEVLVMGGGGAGEGLLANLTRNVGPLLDALGVLNSKGADPESKTPAGDQAAETSVAHAEGDSDRSADDNSGRNH